MSLPIVGGGGRPTRPPTHKPIDPRRLMNIAAELEEAFDLASAEALTPAVAEELAADLGASVAHIYAAAALLTEIPCDATDSIRFELCIGGCQQWGATELLEHLLVRHAQRADSGANFGIVARRCLDKCENAALVLVHTPDGTAGMPSATIAQLDEALAELF